MLKFDNRYCTWEEILNSYPNKWVSIVNPELGTGNSILSGKLLAVGDKSEIDDFTIDYCNSGEKLYRRLTTDIESVGTLNVEGIRIKVIEG